MSSDLLRDLTPSDALQFNKLETGTVPFCDFVSLFCPLAVSLDVKLSCTVDKFSRYYLCPVSSNSEAGLSLPRCSAASKGKGGGGRGGGGLSGI